MLALLALLAAVGSAAPDDGQQPLREGAQVRVNTTLVGPVVSVQGETVTVKSSRGPVVIPFKDITRLEVNHHGRNLKRGALIGGLVGFAAVTTLCVVTFDEDDDYAISTGESFVIGALLGAPVGGAVGLSIGALASPWHDVPVPKAAANRRMAVTLRIRF
jgi:hypothetical protein